MRSVMLRRPRRQNEPWYDPTMILRPKLFASNPGWTVRGEFCSLRIDGVRALTWQTSYKANKFTRKMFYSSACKFQICIWLLSCYMGLFLLVKRKFIMQVLTLMVINCSKHDVKIVNPRTKHHHWNIRTVNKILNNFTNLSFINFLLNPE